MIQKYFPFDKNYLLEKAQLSLEEELVIHLIEHCKSYYLLANNPLGILDDTSLKIMEHQTVYTDRLSEFYRHLCGVYRYKFGNNQLELLFDGSDHIIKYRSDWRSAFISWLDDLCEVPQFIRAVLELTVFYPEDRKADLAANRMKAYIEQYFGIRLYRYKGIVEMKIA
jgi:hypothetical protein